MILKKIKLKNIRSYKEEEIEFPEGSLLLSGDIGSGKTSILLAIEYALFGLQPGQRGSYLLSNDSDSGEVKLEFIVDNKEIIIERSLKRSSKSISQDVASITIDGEKIESSVTEIKTKILDLLNYPLEFIKKNNLLYKYTVYTPQEQMKQIILEDSDSRLDVLRHVFGIDKYKRIKENLQKITSKLREESRFLQVEVNLLEEKKSRLNANIKFVKILNNGILEKEEELNTKRIQTRKIEEEIEKVREKVKERENFKKEAEKAQILIANKEEQLSKIKKEIKDLNEKISSMPKSFNEELFLSLGREINVSSESLNKLNDYLLGISSRLNSIHQLKRDDLEKKGRIFKIDICPTCLQDVSDRHKHNILSETEKNIARHKKEESILDKEMEKTQNDISILKSNISNLEKQKTKMEIDKIKIEDVKNINAMIESAVALEKNLEKDTSILTSHFNNLKASALEFAKFDKLLEIKKTEFKIAMEVEKKKEIEIAETKKEVEIANKEIKELERSIFETEKTKNKMIHYLEIEDWLSNNFQNLIEFTEKKIMTALRSEFSRIFNKWFLILTTDSFHVYLDETFSPIITQGDFELPYSSLSGGERTAVALAYRLALNQIINSILSKLKTQDLVILDEPTDGFSDAQLDKVRDILQELNLKQLIIVSHEQKIESFVGNIIRLKKENGVSVVANK